MSSNNSQSHSRILVLDDNSQSYEIISRILNHIHPNSLDWAKSVPEARDRLRTNEYSLLIADLVIESEDPNNRLANMPVKNELDDLSTLILAIQEKGSLNSLRFPIIVVTGHLLGQARYVEAFNRFPGWIWGWHEKARLNQEDFRRNVAAALEGRIERTHELIAESFASTILTSTATTLIILLPAIFFFLVWLVQTIGWDQIEPFSFIVTIILAIASFAIGLMIFAFYRSENRDSQWINPVYRWLYNLRMRRFRTTQ